MAFLFTITLPHSLTHPPIGCHVIAIRKPGVYILQNIIARGGKNGAGEKNEN